MNSITRITARLTLAALLLALVLLFSWGFSVGVAANVYLGVSLTSVVMTAAFLFLAIMATVGLSHVVLR